MSGEEELKALLENKEKLLTELQNEYDDFKGHKFHHFDIIFIFISLKLTETSKLLEEELEQLTKDLTNKNEALLKDNEKLRGDLQDYKVYDFS